MSGKLYRAAGGLPFGVLAISDERAPPRRGDDQALISECCEHLPGGGLGDLVLVVDRDNRRNHRARPKFTGQDTLPQGVPDPYPRWHVTFTFGHTQNIPSGDKLSPG